VTRVVAVMIAAFAAAALLTPLAMAVATRTGVVDRPGPLKPQSAAVPYLGGVAVFLALLVVAALRHPMVIVPLAGATVLGVLDDRLDMPAFARLLGQAAIATGVAVVVPTRVGGVGGGVLVAAVTVVLMNGVNFLDGLDALAAGSVAVGCVAFAVVLHGGGRDLGVAVAAALMGFLLYNRPPARVYLGDGGSYLLGAALALLLASAWAPGTRSALCVASLAIVAVPVGEVTFAVVRRARARRSIMSGDRRHPYDLAVARGWSRGAAALAYIGAEAVFAVVAVVASKAHPIAVPVACVVGVGVATVTVAAVVGALSPGPGAPV
jgi:UDP-N-acetylmuramyl pentapeptide phosphotransferase/UDP-N-acetylglucosamine-1-phosphate transferase